ncbi:MAG: hypothetical protein IPL71_09570 [Anaerolineales bacterium]|uniref:hypothetical protein n=1 Tax=Candidatus Villigracilis proximus TaxID=3140683 RepID=UPI0031351AFF|nr:hypothetical protein [Anaerolineales bacterium]
MIEAISVIELALKILEKYIPSKKDVFENQVEPLLEKMIVIHKDYIAGFTEFRQHLIKRTKPSNELLDFLKERRRDYAHERQLINDMAEKLKKVQKAGMKNEDIKALQAFAEAILAYFSTSSKIGNISWYSDLIEIVRWQSKYDVDVIPDVWQTTSIEGYSPDILLPTIDSMLNEELPNAFQKVSETYADLRAHLL